ncbi:hypothetical protein [Geobacter anodireducens]|uniref:Uncharacterized protein n=1 Tax=Geobacter anodireducens TaxID=1340425 RepID=A0ABR9NSE9_9BACT|nr:hypothetical protein [Geobacter anodireducens]MBE2887175.1 hypothetical protein [Geobacter anodireducens]
MQLYKCFYDGVPDVRANIFEDKKHTLTRDFGSFVEDYMSGKTYFGFDIFASSKFQELYRWTVNGGLCGAGSVEIIGTVRSKQSQLINCASSTHHADFSVFIPVIRGDLLRVGPS